MLDFSKIIFKQDADPITGSLRVRGGIVLQSQVSLTEQAMPGCSDAERVTETERILRLRLWDAVYGDLRKPIAELLHIAQFGALRAYRREADELEALATKLSDLMKRPL